MRQGQTRGRWLILVTSTLVVLTATASVSSVQSLSLATGDSQQVFGRAASVWARIRPDGTVVEAGVTVPFLTILRAPYLDFQGGPGPARAIAVLAFPPVVQRTTFVNHFELHWAPSGHPPPSPLSVPHWDAHFYGVPVGEVKQVAPATSLPRPDANRIPQGYGVPPTDQAFVQTVVPEMGAHAVPAAAFQPGFQVVSPVMIMGFYQGQLTFIEPAIPQTWLLQKQSLTMEVPRPVALGRTTQYPTLLRMAFDADTNAYQIIVTNFVAAR